MTLTAASAHILQPDLDWGWTWDMHGGADGHIDHKERTRLMAETQYRLQTVCQFSPQNIDLLNDILERLFDPDVVMEETLELVLVSGPSRSGGTYMLKEIAKQYDVDIMAGNIFFYHDYDPVFNVSWLDPKENSTELAMYLATCLAHTKLTGKPAFKRTVLGTIILWHLQHLKPKLTSNVRWVHMVRDFPSAWRSLQAMYSGPEIARRQYVAYSGNTPFFDNTLMALDAWRIGSAWPGVEMCPETVLFEGAQAYAQSDEPFHVKTRATLDPTYEKAYRETRESLSKWYTDRDLPDYFREMA